MYPFQMMPVMFVPVYFEHSSQNAYHLYQSSNCKCKKKKKDYKSLDFKPIDNPKQYHVLLGSNAKKLIRNKRDWLQFIEENPLNLDEELLRRFGKELNFDEKLGFISANYKIIYNKLNFGEFRELFGYLGLSLKFFEDHMDYICEAGDCKSYEGYICNPSSCNFYLKKKDNTQFIGKVKKFDELCIDPCGREYVNGQYACFPDGFLYLCTGDNEWIDTNDTCNPQPC